MSDHWHRAFISHKKRGGFPWDLPVAPSWPRHAPSCQIEHPVRGPTLMQSRGNPFQVRPRSRRRTVMSACTRLCGSSRDPQSSRVAGVECDGRPKLRGLCIQYTRQLSPRQSGHGRSHCGRAPPLTQPSGSNHQDDGSLRQCQGALPLWPWQLFFAQILRGTSIETAGRLRNSFVSYMSFFTMTSIPEGEGSTATI